MNSEKYIEFSNSSGIYELWKTLHDLVKILWKCQFWMVWTLRKIFMVSIL